MVVSFHSRVTGSIVISALRWYLLSCITLLYLPRYITCLLLPKSLIDKMISDCQLIRGPCLDPPNRQEQQRSTTGEVASREQPRA